MGNDTYLETRVMTADPLELICMLYERGVEVVQDARRHLASGDIAARGRAICKAVEIVGELAKSLDHKAGGSISENLERLYRYMMVRLTEGNMRKQDAPLAEVESLLTSLAQAWKQIAREHAGPESMEALVAAGAWQESGNASAHMWDA
jgi:flagellar secretion chaperone FliS